MNKTVCNEQNCTACGACINACPQKCISFYSDEYDVKHAYIEEKRCINCHICNKVCPIHNNIEEKVPFKCYAAYSTDTDIRHNAASGGIATELYRCACEKNYWISGVYLDKQFNARFLLTHDNWKKFQNSKYTFSDMGEIYLDIADKLKEGEKLLFIGLPCQLASLKLFLQFKHIDDTNLILVDLICHGITPEDYLKSHIRNIERKKRKKASSIYFRDPTFQTNTFHFTLSNEKSIFYKKAVNSDDEFQVAYHRGIAYRDNCYSCQWAKRKRLGDITLSDFPGLGTQRKSFFSHQNVSCVMINSKAGADFWNLVLNTGRITSEVRPISENINIQITMNHPTPIPSERAIFLKYYKDTKEFDYSVRVAAKKIIRMNVVNQVTRCRDIQLFLLRHIPRKIKNQIKHICGRR